MGLIGTVGGITDVEISELDGLFDVVITTPVSGQVLQYDALNNRWINATGGGGGGGVSSVSAGVGLSASPNPITGSGEISLTNTGVSAGRYTLATLDIDAQGRIVSAATGAAGSGTVTSAAVSGNNGITVAGSPITTEGVIVLGLGNITPTTISTGAVSAASVNVAGDILAATGRITASAATLSAKFTGATASFSGLVSADGGINTTTVSAASINVTGDVRATTGTILASAATLTAKFTGATAAFSGKVSADAGLNTTTVSAASIGVTGDINASTGRVLASAATLTAKLTGATAAFSGLVSADAGLNTTTVSAASIGVTGDINAAAGRVLASAMTISALLTGATATFSGMVSANAGLSTTTGNFSGLLTGSTATFSGLVSANAGLRATTVSASGVIGGSNLSGTNTGDQTITLTGDVSGSGTGSFATTINPATVTNAKLANMAAGTIKSNITSSAAVPSDSTLTALIDSMVSGASQGAILYRGGSGIWAQLSAGTNGQLLTTGGVSANPSWTTASGTGTVTSVSAGAGIIGSPNPITGAGSIQLDTSSQNSWTAQQGFATATLTDASAVSWNLKSQQVAFLSRKISGTAQMSDPTNMVNGNTYILMVEKASANTATLTFTSAYRWPGSTSPTLSTTSGARDVFTFVCIASVMYGSYTQNYSQP